MSKRAKRVAALQPRRSDGTWTPTVDTPEPCPPLLEAMRSTAQASVRQVWNDPGATVQVARQVLEWILRWNPDRDPPLRSVIALKAANEARRLKSLTGQARRSAATRSKHGRLILWQTPY